MPANSPLTTARRLRSLAVLGLAVAGLTACGGQSVPKLTVVARGLANPRHLTVAADGAVYVAEAGDGGRARCARDVETGHRICLGPTGAIGRLAGGRLRPVVTALPSVAAADGREASGPADVVATPAGLAVVVQDTKIDATGANQFGPLGRALGRLVLAPAAGGPLRLGADLARYEALHNPDRGAGATPATRLESDPYGLVAYRGGYAVADAAANDLVWVDRAGQIHVLAVFPTQTVPAPAGAQGPRRVVAQAVPTSVAVGPDGDLYVGELTGYPFRVATARVWRVVPGVAPTVYAGGFTTISALAFDRTGRLLVLEIDRLGLNGNAGRGELIRVGRDGRRTVLVADGLEYPTGLAVAPDGSIYIANDGTQPSTGAGPHGEILRLSPP